MSPKCETIIFNGRKFRRYPESKRNHLRNYFWTSQIKSLGRSLSLHQEIYKAHHKIDKIPAGFHVHHKDENPLNNDIGNLECKLGFNHLSEHMKKRDIVKQRATMDHARKFASLWHGSPEGIEWHKKHWENSIGKNLIKTARELTCQHCNVKYVTNHLGESKFCSNKCRSLNRTVSGIDKEKRICSQCGSEFSTSKYGTAKSCSYHCAGLLRKKWRHS